jgi:hypothetical protein
MKMYRYALFFCHQYYPNGGWNDLVGTYARIGSAVKSGLRVISKQKKAIVEYGERPWWEIVDLTTGKVIRSMHAHDMTVYNYKTNKAQKVTEEFTLA